MSYFFGIVWSLFYFASLETNSYSASQSRLASSIQQGMSYFYWSCWWLRNPTDPQMLWTIADILGSLKNLMVRLLLKASHICLLKHRDIILVLTWKPHSYILVFIVLEGAMHATSHTELWTLKAPLMTSLVWYASYFKGRTTVVVTRLICQYFFVWSLFNKLIIFIFKGN